MRNKIIGLFGLGVLALSAVIVFQPSLVKANPFEFLLENNGTQSPTATTSVTYMTPGTATTTYTYDTYAGSSADPYATNNLALELQLTGSSTPVATSNYATTTYSIAIEYSNDNLDWYSDNYTPFATTTVNVNPTTPITRTITLGYSQLTDGSLLATTTPTKRLINVQAPTRYVRAVISIPIGTNATNGAVWGQFAGQKETPQ